MLYSVVYVGNAVGCQVTNGLSFQTATDMAIALNADEVADGGSGADFVVGLHDGSPDRG